MINTTFTKSSDYTHGIDVRANGVFVGVLIQRGDENLHWYAGLDPSIVRYSLSDEQKFSQVINAIKQYYYEHDFKTLTIDNINNGIGTWHDEHFWKKYGFTANEWPTHLVLTEDSRN